MAAAPTPVYRWALLMSALVSPSLGFISCSYQRMNSMPHLHHHHEQVSTKLYIVGSNNDNTMARSDFISLLGTFIAFAPNQARAFDGGVGGLGKTRPQTGVIFRDPEAAAETTQSNTGDVNYELVAPDGSPVFLSFNAHWPLLKSAAGIEARDMGGYESSFVQVAELPKGTTLDKVKPAMISQTLFGSTGKFGMYGSPTDVKTKKLESSGNSGLFLASFTTLTPAMRESDRKAYVSASVVGDGLFLLVTTTTAARFGKLDGALRKVADSFTAIPAPASSLKKGK